MANIPSVTKTQEMAVGHYDKDELDTYIQAVICKIEKAAKKDYFLQELNTKKLLIILFIMIIIMIVVVD